MANRSPQTPSIVGTSSDQRNVDSLSDIAGIGWTQIGRRTFQALKDDKVPVLAAGLAFYAMLSVFPALIAAVSIYGLFSDPDQIQRQIDSLANVLPQEAASLIGAQLETIVEASASALTWTALLAILAALWTASSGAQQLITAVSAAYQQRDDDRGFLQLRAMALVFTLGFIVVGLLSLGLIVVIPPLLADLGLGGWRWVLSIGRFVILAGVMVLTLAVVYRFAPDRPAENRPGWTWVSWGAVIATVIWIISSILFTIYVASFGNFGATYGSLGGVIILMLWFLISGFVVLLGAIINSEMERQAERTAV